MQNIDAMGGWSELSVPSNVPAFFIEKLLQPRKFANIALYGCCVLIYRLDVEGSPSEMSTDFQEIGLSHRVHRLRESLGDLVNSSCVRMIIHPLLKYRAGEIGLPDPLPIIKRHNVGGHCVRLLFDIAPAAGKL